MIDPPKRPGEYPDRDVDCQAALETAFQDLTAEACAAGWGPAEVRRALVRLLAADRRKDEETAAFEAYLALLRAMNRAAGS